MFLRISIIAIVLLAFCNFALYRWDPIIAVCDYVSAQHRMLDRGAEEAAGIFCSSPAPAGCYALDENGKVFSRAPYAEGQLALVVQGFGTSSPARQEKVLTSDEMRNFQEVFGALSANGLSLEKIRLREDRLYEWEVELKNGVKLYFDRAFIPKDLEKVVSALAERRNLSSLHYVDFRVPNRIYFR